MDPLVFEPYLRPQIWGHRRLEQQLGKRLPAGTFGESWEISGHKHHVSCVAEGALRGRLLTALWSQHAAELLGPGQQHADQFPLLVKFLDCHRQLSVQVHPTDELAATLLGDEQGKTEAWVIVSAEPTVRIYAGLVPGTTPDILEQHLAAGTVAECLHSFVPRAGDCLFLPAGTVHAVGGGVVMAEVQQSSDATFRLFDWNHLGPDGKPRPLHIEESLRSIDWNAGPAAPVKPKPVGDRPGVVAESLVESRYFSLTRYQPSVPLPLPYPGELSIWLVLAGGAVLKGTQGYERTFRAGEAVLVPASAGQLEWRPTAADQPPTLLGVRVP